MPLIKSISGFRGTIGGLAGENLTPQDVVACTAAFGQWVLQTTKNPTIVVGTDARISREWVSALVVGTLNAQGIDVVDVGLSTTPTVEMAVVWEQAGGGIVITASHNPAEWNALKLLNHRGEFISAADGQAVLRLLEAGAYEYAPIHKLGRRRIETHFIERHVQSVVELAAVDAAAVRERALKIVVDPVNSTGALAVPVLLDALGCSYTAIHADLTGQFAHNPEPLPEHLTQLSEAVVRQGADLGIAVDPDVDRLVFICEDGQPFGEEYTLVAVADYILSRDGHADAAVVSNLSSSRALRDVAARYGAQYFAAAVGEVNVVEKMKRVGAIIGGEGNGGVIYPALHYGRDALVGIGLFLSHLARSRQTVSDLRRRYPDYFMVKGRIERGAELPLERVLEHLRKKYRHLPLNTEDGLKIDFPNGWVHLRPSNTEPIIRLYAEAPSLQEARALEQAIRSDIASVL